jgi:hypothetical protein
VAHVEEAAAGFTDHGKSFGQKVVEGGTLGEFFLEFDGLSGEIDIGELLHGGLEGGDGGHAGLHALDLALGFSPEEFR